MKKITFLIPAFNEEGNIFELYKQIQSSVDKLTSYKFEFLFIENGSTDETFKKILNYLKKILY